METRRFFRLVWWICNLALAAALVAAAYTGVWEFSVRKYLDGFSDAIVSDDAPSREKIETILAWMSNGPSRSEVPQGASLSPRDPQYTLNYRQLLDVCGSSTNAFLNLSRSSGLETRRLLLLTPQNTTKHVVAEIHLDGHWIVVDPSYRTILKDARGNLLTSEDLRNPEIFREATSGIPGYPPEYSYDHPAHVHLSALPYAGPRIRRILDRFIPHWDDQADWSLLLERRSFFYLFLSVSSLIFLLLIRVLLAWLADHYLQVRRFRLREKLSRAKSAFFASPEIQ